MNVRIRSVYAVGITDHLSSQFGSDKDIVLEVDSGTTVEGLLRRLSSLGPAQAFDDLMIHVFVNGRVRGFDYVLQPKDVVDIHIPVSGG